MQRPTLRLLLTALALLASAVCSGCQSEEAKLLEHPEEAGPHGAKGVAEPPIVPVAAAIANAIADATGGAIGRIPITPEDVLDALAENRQP